MTPGRGALDLQELLRAYAVGCFPMDQAGATGPITFFEADPRAVLPVDAFRVPASVRRAVRRGRYEVWIDRDFPKVVSACAAGRDDGVWLTARLASAYEGLHEAGCAHSIETWHGGRLRGGIFGVALGGLYTSESMFHLDSDAGNVALVAAGQVLARAGFTLWDIQVASDHTRRFGVRELAPDRYRRELRAALALPERSFPTGRFDVAERPPSSRRSFLERRP